MKNLFAALPAPGRLLGVWLLMACAILTGIGTVLQDDPRLDARLPNITRQPHLVIVDSALDTPATARLFEPAHGGWPRQVVIYHAVLDSARQAALAERGAILVHMPGAENKVDLSALLRDLAQREVNELHLEAGHKLNGSFIREGLVDEYLVYLAPQLLGPGQGMANLPVLTALGDAVQLGFHAVERIGPDLRLLLRRA